MAGAATAWPWKILRSGKSGPWSLFHLGRDPFENGDVADQHPEVTKKLADQWTAWSENNQVLPLFHNG